MDAKHLTSKYFRIYNQIIDNRLNNPLEESVYREKHHIIPKSFGGSDGPSNIVYVSGREHYLLHYLLTKFTEGEQRSKMLFAFNAFNMKSPNGNQKERKINSHIYEGIRKELHKIDGFTHYGMLGKVHSDDTKNKMSEKKKGSNNPMYGRRPPNAKIFQMFDTNGNLFVEGYLKDVVNEIDLPEVTIRKVLSKGGGYLYQSPQATSIDNNYLKYKNYYVKWK